MDWIDPAHLEMYAGNTCPEEPRLDDVEKRLAEIDAVSSDQLAISVWRPASDLYVISLAGAVIMTNAADLATKLEDELVSGPLCVIIDLSRLTSIDPTGITSLLVIAKGIKEQGGTMLLVAAPRANVARALELLNLTEAIVVTGSLEAALRAINECAPRRYRPSSSGRATKSWL